MAFRKRKSKKLKKIQGVYELGDLVLLNKKRQGIIKYIGQLHNKDGVWYGIELTADHKGENNGNIGKHKYFECNVKGKGIFAKPKHLQQILAKSQKKKNIPSQQQQQNEEKQQKQQKQDEIDVIHIDDIIGSPMPPSNLNGIIDAESDEFEMDDPIHFEPFRSPSQQKMLVTSNLDEMLRKTPKKNVKKSNNINNISILEDDIKILTRDLEIYNDAEIEVKRIQIKAELNSLRPIELIEKLSEYMLNTDMDIDKIQMLQNMINYQY